MISTSRSDSVHASHGFEVAGWFLALLLGSLIYFLPLAAVPGRQPKLMAVVVALAVANLLLHRAMPESSEGPIRYGREDKALIVSLTMVLLLTGFFYVIPESSDTLTYLYLVPLFASTLVLHENVVLSEALFSLLAMVFLHAASWMSGPFLDGEFSLRLVIFATASACLVIVTRSLRQAFGRAERLSGELSIRLDQLQVINMLVRQGEYTTQLDRLATRTGGIIADAIDAERYAIFVLDGDGKELRRVGEGANSDLYDRDLMSVDGNLQLLRGVLETGAPRIFDGEPGGIERFVGNARIRDMLVMPLKVREASIGVFCLLNRRSGRFAADDVHYCELLTGFAATLLNAALLFQRTLDERQTVERMAKLMVGREIKMRELKGRIKDSGDL